MLYLWEMPKCLNKDIAVYDQERSPNRFLLRRGNKLDTAEFSRCYAYARSVLVDLQDDFFIRTHLRRTSKSAYLFTSNEMFCFAGGGATKININTENLKKIKTLLSLTDHDIDQEPKVLTDAQLEAIAEITGVPPLSRIPILHLSKVTASMVREKYDCIPNNSASLLVNQKIVDILLRLAPDDVQFFDTEVQCKDAVLTEYKLINLTCKIIGIDREKSIYSLFGDTDAILGFKYLTYHPGCMGKHKLARDAEYLGNILATEEIKQAFKKEKIKGARFITPEEFYAMIYGTV